MVPATKRFLGVLVKKPQAGLVKSRLAAATSGDFAAAVAEAFLLDLLPRLLTLPVPCGLVYAPADAEPYFAELAQGQFSLWPQSTGDLGQRLASCCAAQFQRGTSQVVLIGTDSPTLPLAFIDQAFRELDRADVVLGPATDGGYYLIGMSRFLPQLFEGISWSSPQVLGQTVDRLAPLSARFALLPPWYDVDTLADLEMLHGHIRALRAAGYDPGLPRTEKLLACRLALGESCSHP